jgi:hypothetical protein
MSALRFTLVTDGPTDAVLLRPLRWLLIKNGVGRPIEATWADLRLLPKPPTQLVDKIRCALDLYPCDLIFVHRDAEKEPPENRIAEIRRSLNLVSSDLFTKPRTGIVCVVPVRMTEAWFLFDEANIRRAAGNPAGTLKLSLPPGARVESLPDPKETLRELFVQATELPPRRLKGFKPGQALRRLAELIEDFSPLRQLPAFRELEREIKTVIETSKWNFQG